MAYNNPIELADSLVKKPVFYYDKDNQAAFDDYLKKFTFGDTKYDDERQEAALYLANQYKLSPDQAADVIDSYITKATHYRNGPSTANLRKKAGRFETGAKWEDAQAAAQKLRDANPDARGVIYGLRFDDEKPRGNTGLKKPFLVYGDDPENIARSLQNGKEKSRFQIDTLY